MKKLMLHADWTVSAAKASPDAPADLCTRTIPATVPGCIHTDLRAAGLIDDPYYGENETKLQWVGRTDWRYRCAFSADAALLKRDRVELVCEGLDTVARVELNGKLLGETFNMRHPHRFDVRDALRAGENELVVTFHSALAHAEEMEKRLGVLPHTGHGTNPPVPHNCIRKTACDFGWDWGPVMVTCGIWQPIYVQAYDTARIASVRPLVRSADQRRAALEVLVDVDRAAAGELTLTATLTGPDGSKFEQRAAVPADRTSASIRFDVSRPRLWWPVGHGDHPLYNLSVRLTGGKSRDRFACRVGLRTTELDTRPDKAGSRFVLKVNGKEIFCKGADWIPDDCFYPARTDAARLRRRLDQALRANMNILRVWGGGLYESDAFYDLCDEMGLMVWQDFAFACAAYAEEEPLRGQVLAEARHNVVRLSRHPSLVLWNGCNENILGYFHWGPAGNTWKDVIGTRTWGLGYYLDLLPTIVKEWDGTRPYWPGSPYSGSMDISPNDGNHGNRHVWNVWFGGHYHNYYKNPSRFCSEFGFQAPPTWATLEASIPPDQRRENSPAMLVHQKCQSGYDMIRQCMSEDFPAVEAFDDWHYLAQLFQARALKAGVSFYRSLQPFCMGAIYWQLNDCWPVTSWAAIDSEERLKPLWYASRKFFADRVLIFQPTDGEIALLANNDSDRRWTGTLTLRRLNFAGQTLAVRKLKLNVPPRTNKRLLKLPKAFHPGDAAGEMLVAQAGTVRETWFFTTDKNLAYPAPRFRATLARRGRVYRLTVTAETLLRDLCLFV
ncbi:MAG TPA: beta-mannosidase, partial [Phycisphaerales bacterium]|nr:beta-mannosidase [Phycisphaerales bacterium]